MPTPAAVHASHVAPPHMMHCTGAKVTFSPLIFHMLHGMLMAHTALCRLHSQGAAGGETEVTMTSTDLNLDLSQWRDLDIDMTEEDMDGGTETAPQGAVRAVRGSQVKLTFCSPGH